ncbi:MAG: hypothetical protein ACSHXW_17570 [Yoonia sp.]
MRFKNQIACIQLSAANPPDRLRSAIERFQHVIDAQRFDRPEPLVSLDQRPARKTNKADNLGPNRWVWQRCSVAVVRNLAVGRKPELKTDDTNSVSGDVGIAIHTVDTVDGDYAKID